MRITIAECKVIDDPRHPSFVKVPINKEFSATGSLRDLIFKHIRMIMNSPNLMIAPRKRTVNGVDILSIFYDVVNEKGSLLLSHVLHMVNDKGYTYRHRFYG
jgi:hypothetical protein